MYITKSGKKEAPQFPDLLLHQVGVRGLLRNFFAKTPITVNTKHSNPLSLNFAIYITSIINSMLPHQLRRLNELLIVHDSRMKLSSERGMSALPYRCRLCYMIHKEVNSLIPQHIQAFSSEPTYMARLNLGPRMQKALSGLI